MGYYVKQIPSLHKVIALLMKRH